MWQRFTERARRAILMAQESSVQLGGSCIESEHFLLALVRDQGCGAGQMLQKAGVPLHAAEQALVKAITPPSKPAREPKLMPSAKRILEYSANEARRLRADYIGTEHMLLGFLHEEHTPRESQRILQGFGLELESTRALVKSSTGEEPLDGRDSSSRLRLKNPFKISPIGPVQRNIEANLLLHLLSDENGFIARTLVECGLDLEAARRKLKQED